ncbi:hypothetical protein P7D97_01555 [Enterococcus raffinosus]|uniref:hypothetical protein n=1 Tax=Enterococcus raffinosus TaxID=71452 RepID=UPI00288D378E|nr:hypothetical protein [Enterococcus raffinosus]MDT2570285.1 hypothetical protein [Enterococcus raffinosus]
MKLINCESCKKPILVSDDVFRYNSTWFHYDCLEFEQRLTEGQEDISDVFDKNKIIVIGEIDTYKTGSWEAEEMYYDLEEGN